jgi:hypothetical protein
LPLNLDVFGFVPSKPGVQGQQVKSGQAAARLGSKLAGKKRLAVNLSPKGHGALGRPVLNTLERHHGPGRCPAAQPSFLKGNFLFDVGP